MFKLRVTFMAVDDETLKASLKLPLASVALTQLVRFVID